MNGVFDVHGAWYSLFTRQICVSYNEVKPQPPWNILFHFRLCEISFLFIHLSVVFCIHPIKLTFIWINPSFRGNPTLSTMCTVSEYQLLYLVLNLYKNFCVCSLVNMLWFHRVQQGDIQIGQTIASFHWFDILWMSCQRLTILFCIWL